MSQVNFNRFSNNVFTQRIFGYLVRHSKSELSKIVEFQDIYLFFLNMIFSCRTATALESTFQVFSACLLVSYVCPISNDFSIFQCWIGSDLFSICLCFCLGSCLCSSSCTVTENECHTPSK